MISWNITVNGFEFTVWSDGKTSIGWDFKRYAEVWRDNKEEFILALDKLNEDWEVIYSILVIKSSPTFWEQVYCENIIEKATEIIRSEYASDDDRYWAKKKLLEEQNEPGIFLRRSEG